MKPSKTNQQTVTILSTPTRSLACLPAADEVAWLFNLRGGDVAYNPVFVRFSVLFSSGRADLRCRVGFSGGAGMWRRVLNKAMAAMA